MSTSSLIDPSPGAGSDTPPTVERLKAGSVGLTSVMFMALATAAPITAMTGNLPIIIGGGSGTAAPGAFIFVTGVLLLFTVGYVAMARHITAAGAFYGYISHGLGRIVGMASGLLAVLAYVVFEASIVGIFAYFAQSAIQSSFGVDVKWYYLAGAMIAVVCALAYFDLHIASRVLSVALVAEVLMLALLAISIIFHGGGKTDGLAIHTLNPLKAFAGPSAGIGLFFCFWSWVGFESTAMYGEESRNPKRIIPRATIIAVVGLGVLYSIVAWTTLSGNGLAHAIDLAGSNPLNLFYDASEQYLGHWARVLLEWLMCSSAFACGMAFHQCASRYLYAIGREGFLHKGLGRTHPEHGSPFIASFTQTAITVAIVGGYWAAGKDPYVNLYTVMAVLGTMALLIVQTLCSFAVIAYFRKNHPESRHWFRTLVAPALGGLGMIAAIYLLVANLDFAGGAAAKDLVFKLIPYIVGAVFVGGIVYGLYTKSRNPAKYEILGRIVMEDAQERTGEEEAVTA
jgi:amino acid transporter